MRIHGRKPAATVLPNASGSLRAPHLDDEGERLFDAYLETFQEAPEADYLLKEYFFTMYFEKEYLQDNVFFIPRDKFLWFFTYYIDEDKGVRTIELKKRSTTKAETEVELATINIRRHYTVEEGAADIIYTRRFSDREGVEFVLKNTKEAVTHVAQLLADFRSDRVTAQPY